MVIPFFLIVLFALVYAHNRYSRSVEVNMRARECAWLFANQGCGEEIQLPPECQNRSGSLSGYGSMTDLPGAGGSAEGGGQSQDRRSALGEAVAQLDGASSRILGLGSGVRMQASGRTARPPLFGGGQQVLRSHYSVLCNEKSRGFLDFVSSFFCGLVGSGWCG